MSGTVALSAEASDMGGIAGVQLHVDGLPVGAEVTTAPYAVEWDTTGASDGPHSITAVARDIAGNTTTSPGVSVTVANDSVAPTVVVTAPAAGATVSGTMSVTATASDDTAVAGVQMHVDGLPMGAEDTTAPFSVSWNTRTVANGEHTITAVARDHSGNTATSAPVGVTAQNQTAECEQILLWAGENQLMFSSATHPLPLNIRDDTGANKVLANAAINSAGCTPPGTPRPGTTCERIVRWADDNWVVARSAGTLGPTVRDDVDGNVQLAWNAYLTQHCTIPPSVDTGETICERIVRWNSDNYAVSSRAGVPLPPGTSDDVAANQWIALLAYLNEGCG